MSRLMCIVVRACPHLWCRGSFALDADFEAELCFHLKQSLAAQLRSRRDLCSTAGGQANRDVLTAANVLQLRFRFQSIVCKKIYIKKYIKNQTLTVNNKEIFHWFLFWHNGAGGLVNQERLHNATSWGWHGAENRWKSSYSAFNL